MARIVVLMILMGSNALCAGTQSKDAPLASFINALMAGDSKRAKRQARVLGQEVHASYLDDTAEILKPEASTFTGLSVLRNLNQKKYGKTYADAYKGAKPLPQFAHNLQVGASKRSTLVTSLLFTLAGFLAKKVMLHKKYLATKKALRVAEETLKQLLPVADCETVEALLAAKELPTDVQFSVDRYREAKRTFDTLEMYQKAASVAQWGGATGVGAYLASNMGNAFSFIKRAVSVDEKSDGESHPYFSFLSGNKSAEEALIAKAEVFESSGKAGSLSHLYILNALGNDYKKGGAYKHYYNAASRPAKVFHNLQMLLNSDITLISSLAVALAAFLAKKIKLNKGLKQAEEALKRAEIALGQSPEQALGVRNPSQALSKKIAAYKEAKHTVANYKKYQKYASWVGWGGLGLAGTSFGATFLQSLFTV